MARDTSFAAMVNCAVTAAGPTAGTIGRRNANIARFAAGIFDVTIGPGPGTSGGVDAREAKVSCAVSTGAAGAARTITVTHTSDNVKRLTIADSAGNVQEDVFLSFAIERVKNVSLT